MPSSQRAARITECSKLTASTRGAPYLHDFLTAFDCSTAANRIPKTTLGRRRAHDPHSRHKCSYRSASTGTVGAAISRPSRHRCSSLAAPHWGGEERGLRGFGPGLPGSQPSLQCTLHCSGYRTLACPVSPSRLLLNPRKAQKSKV